MLLHLPIFCLKRLQKLIVTIFFKCLRLPKLLKLVVRDNHFDLWEAHLVRESEQKWKFSTRLPPYVRSKVFEKIGAIISIYRWQVAKMSWLFFNYLDLPLAKVVLVLFGKNHLDLSLAKVWKAAIISIDRQMSFERV